MLEGLELDVARTGTSRRARSGERVHGATTGGHVPCWIGPVLAERPTAVPHRQLPFVRRARTALRQVRNACSVAGTAPVLLTALLAALSAVPAAAATVEVRFAGLPSDRGRALFALFAEADGFPDRSEAAFARLGGSVAGGSSRVVFENVTPGDYALSALHDENESGAIDMNLFGIPKEKFGVSNVAKGRPTWADALFSIAREGDVVVIELKPLRFF